jgi:hypothetical protein
LGGWRWFVAKHYYLLGEIGWLGCCLCVKISVYDSVFLYLKPKMPLISAEKPLPPRGDMHDHFAPNRRLSKINCVDTILCGIGFVCFNEFIQGIVVVPF